MSLNRRRFVSWIERRMVSADLPRRFELVHIDRGSRSVVCRLAPKAEVGADDIGEQLADEVHQEVIDHVEAWSGRQNYVVRALSEDGREIAEFAFFQVANSLVHTHAAHEIGELTPEQDALGGGRMPLAEQLGHPTAMVATQLMRHTEALTRHLVEVTSMQRERDAQIIRQQQQAIDKHETQHLKFMEMVEDMTSRRQERALAQAEHDANEARKAETFERINTLVLPAVAEKMGFSGPKAEDVLKELRSIFFSLPEEMQESVSAALPAEQKQKLFAILGSGEAGATKH